MKKKFGGRVPAKQIEQDFANKPIFVFLKWLF
jgi:hypothetical protein